MNAGNSTFLGFDLSDLIVKIKRVLDSIEFSIVVHSVRGLNMRGSYEERKNSNQRAKL